MKKKILIATPIHTDNLILQYVSSVFQLINNKDTPFEVNIFWRRGSLVNRGRNELVGYFLESDYEYIFFIDSDIVNFVESFYQIASSYIEIEKNNPLLVLGAIYPIKHFNFDYLKNENQLKENDWQQIMLNFNVNIQTLGIDNNSLIKECNDNNGFVNAISIGGGFMMFSKYVVNKMIEKYPETEYRNFANDNLVAKKNYNLFHSFVEPESKFYLSEDYGFCYNFKKMGGLILTNIKIKLSHYGEQIFTGSLYDSLKLKNIKNEELSKKNLILSIPRAGNHIIRTFIEYFTQYPTAGLIDVDNDQPIYTRSKINFDIKNKDEFIYYKQHDVMLNEKHYVTQYSELNNLIFIIRDPLEIFIREDNFNNDNKHLIPYKQQFKDVFFNNIDFYEKFNGKKILLYYEDIIQNKNETIIKLYDFLNINNKERLEKILNSIDIIYEETLRLSKSTNGAISTGTGTSTGTDTSTCTGTDTSTDINYYSNKFKDTESYQQNKDYTNQKINENEYYKSILNRYL
jgi:hypothetical protein